MDNFNLKISKANNYWKILIDVSTQIFSIFLIGYLFFFLLDELFDGFISNFVNLNYLLFIVIISGIITAVFNNEKTLNTENEKPIATKYANLIGILLALFATIIVFIKIYSFGILLSLIISILSGILIWLISFLFLNNQEKE